MLLLIWLVSLALAVTAIAVMLILVAARSVRIRRESRRAALRRRLLPVVLAYGEGRAGEAEVAEAASHDPALAADLAVELIELVRGGDRDRLVALFSRIGVPQELRARLGRGKTRRRELAAEALALFPDEASAAALSDALADGDAEVRLAAAIALSQTGRAPPLAELVARLGPEAARSRRILDLFRRLAGDHSEAMRTLAADQDQPRLMRAAAVDAIASAGDYGSVDIIAGLAAAEGGELKAECIRALGRLAHPAGRDVVVESLDDADWQVRAEAAEAAGRIGLADMTARLAERLEDGEWWVRLRAGQALAALGPAGHETLARLAETGSDRTRRTAALVLAETERVA